MGDEKTKGILISRVDAASIGTELDIESGDYLLDINGTSPRDIIDYRWLTAGEEVELCLRKSNGECWQIEIEKEWDEPLGLHFEPPYIRQVRNCPNRCIFCFVDQNPPGMRESVYFKDDDYLLSFLEGNFITLNALQPHELKRIVQDKISPLYVSIHTTNPELREKMMRCHAAAGILERLKYLTEGGVFIQGQIVLCPGWNDGFQLERTLTDLVELGSCIQSVAVVPVGLTDYRQDLLPLSPVSAKDAQKALDTVHRFQEEMYRLRGTRFVFGADELYGKAGYEIPAEEHYEDYPQLSNGVGLVRLFEEDYRKWVAHSSRDGLKVKLIKPLNVALVTGVAAQSYLEKVTRKLCWEIEGLQVRLEVIPNQFFGLQVTVAGLLTGEDLLRYFRENDFNDPPLDLIIFPRIMLKEWNETFLDNRTPEELSSLLGVPFYPADNLEEIVEIIDMYINRTGEGVAHE